MSKPADISPTPLTEADIEHIRTMEAGIYGPGQLTLVGQAAEVYREFEAAAKEMRDAALAHQRASARYQDAVKALSRLAAPNIE